MRKRLAAALAAIPLTALTVAIPLVNRDEPRIAGLPFLMAWILFWILACPIIMSFVNARVERR